MQNFIIKSCCDLTKCSLSNPDVIQAHEEEVEALQRHHQAQLAGQRSQMHDLQQCLAQKTHQLDILAADHSNAVEVRFHKIHLCMPLC